MESQAQSFKTIETKNLKLQVYNASENSFGVASVIISGKTDAILINAQFTLVDAEKVAQEIKESGKKLTTIFVSHGDLIFTLDWKSSKNISLKLPLMLPLKQ